MKLSVSIPDEDLDFIDRYASQHGVESRSGVVHRAVALLRATELGDDYAAAWAEWADADAEVWEQAVADGLG
ncbi:MAG TPA: ribbon-helix-helix domain-containing protein [Acidimicrobiales bacterium]|nr:ribbon-helix-helix domain-containing protein [Acidimicrobiales bacterium]